MSNSPPIGRQLFESLLAEVHPLCKEITRPLGAGYYWAVMESEYATDVMFRQRASLQALYPSLLRHGRITFGAPQVLRFLGRQVNRDGGINARLHDEVTTDLKRRPEGMRIKHRAGKNTLKMYDKAGTVLRVETTINQSRDFKVYRTREGACLGEAPRNRPLRSGVADLHRRAQVSAAANERYLPGAGQRRGGAAPGRTGSTSLSRPRPRRSPLPRLASLEQGRSAIAGDRQPRRICHPGHSQPRRAQMALW